MNYLTKLAQENGEAVDSVLPGMVKAAVRNHQHHHLAAARLGVTDFSLAKIAEYFGGRIAARYTKWRPVKEGLQALRDLRG